MTIITTNTDIGSSATGASFVTGTKVWAGGTTSFQSTEPLEVATGQTVTGRDSIIVCQGIGASSSRGHLRLFNCTIDFTNSTPAGNNQNHDLTFDDVTIYSSKSAYFHTSAFSRPDGNPPIWNWNNVNIESDINPGDSSECYHLIFAGDIDLTDSTFTNVSFWNGETIASGNARGGSFALNTLTAYPGLRTGPFGLWTNSRTANPGERSIGRFANEGIPNVTRTNHWGPVYNWDFRALGEQSGNNRSWVIVVDNSASPWIINPYVGRPSTSGTDLYNGRLSFVSYFGGTQGGRARIVLGTNPRTTAGSGDHYYIISANDFTNVNNDNELFELPTTIDTRTVPTPLTPTDGIITNPSRGFLFSRQLYDRDSGGDNNQTLANRIAINSPGSVSFRKISWMQQPDDNTFNRTIVVAAPADRTPTNNTSDADIAAAVTAGYSTLDNSGWTSEFDVNDPVDNTIVATRIANFQGAMTIAEDTGGITTGPRVAAVLKAWAIDQNTNTNFEPIGYSYDTNDSTRLIIPTGKNVRLQTSAPATPINATNINLSVPSTGVTADSNVATVRVTDTLFVNSGVFSGVTSNNLSSQVSWSASILNFNNISIPAGNWNGDSVTNFNTTIEENVTLSGGWTVPTGTGDVELVISPNADLTGLAITNPTNRTLNIFGVTSDYFTTAPDNTGTGTINFIQQHPITPGITSGGRWGVARSASGDFTDATVSTAAEDLDGTQRLVLNSNDTAVYRVYLKQDSILGGAGYYITIGDYTTDSTKSSRNGNVPRTVVSTPITVNPELGRVPDVFIEDLVAPPTGPTDPSIVSQPSTTAEIDLIHSNLADPPGPAETMALYLDMTNQDNWFDWHLANAYPDNSVVFGANFASGFVAGRVRGNSPGSQQQVNQTTGLVPVEGGTSPDTFNRVINQPVGAPPIGVVVSAVQTTLNNNQVPDGMNRVRKLTRDSALSSLVDGTYDSSTNYS